MQINKKKISIVLHTKNLNDIFFSLLFHTQKIRNKIKVNYMHYVCIVLVIEHNYIKIQIKLCAGTFFVEIVIKYIIS